MPENLFRSNDKHHTRKRVYQIITDTALAATVVQGEIVFPVIMVDKTLTSIPFLCLIVRIGEYTSTNARLVELSANTK